MVETDTELQQVASKADFTWRDDDAVALYLACCRYILETMATTVSDPFVGYSTVQERAIETMQHSADLPIAVALPLHESEGDGLIDDCCTSIGSALSNDQPDAYIPPSLLPHVAILPVSFPTIPIYYTETELERIEGTNCHGYATRMIQQIEMDWVKLSHVLSAFDETIGCASSDQANNSTCWCRLIRFENMATLERYKWALSNVYSRSSDFQRDGRPARVIAPIFDMMNHDFDSMVSHVMDTQGNLSVYNGQRIIETGEEITLSYGTFSNEKMLFIYGFTVPNNRFDVVSIYAPLDTSDPLQHIKARILYSKCGIENTNEPHLLYAQKILQEQAIIPESLLSVLRVVGISSTDEVLSIATREKSEDGSIGMISLANEASSLIALQQALYTMSRQIALNLISDEGLQAASRNHTIVVRKCPEALTSNDSMTTQTRAAEVAEQRLKDSNFVNARNLCQSEYRVLRYALNELSDKLEAIERGIDPSQ
jgi:hypothetical protein